jgi:sulfotransferase
MASSGLGNYLHFYLYSYFVFMKKLHLIAGMPRSGSTLLCNLLNMNNRFHATATSPVIDVLGNIRSTFSHNITFKTNDRASQYESVRRGMNGFIKEFYHDKEVVFDKCRGWSNNLPLLDTVLGHDNTKIIWTYRNPVEIVSSIEKHYQKTILLENADEGGGADFSTLSARVDNFINDGGIVARPVWLLNDAYEMGYADRILIVNYWELTNNTQETLDKIHDFIGEERYQYDAKDFKDLKQTTQEFDGIYNFKFPHIIKEGEVKYVQHDINLPPHIIEKINTRFSWINDLVRNG